MYDELTGLYYWNARYYDFDNGDLLSHNTYRSEQIEGTTWNLYAYCTVNPINYVDPSGYVVDTALAIASVYSFYKKPSLKNRLYILWNGD